MFISSLQKNKCVYMCIYVFRVVLIVKTVKTANIICYLALRYLILKKKFKSHLFLYGGRSHNIKNLRAQVYLARRIMLTLCLKGSRINKTTNLQIPQDNVNKSLKTIRKFV